MNPVAFIEAKRDGLPNEAGQIREFVRLVSKGELADYQISAWLMAVFFNGLSEEENSVFTEALAGSGRRVRFPDSFLAVDKHSTGGVGDKTTLIVVPLAAACGVPVAKLSGRGLGFTGGTIDKLESIPGFRSRLDMETFMRQVEETGCAVSGHSGELAPAEARFYELRDVTGTIPSIPLITSSIVSKKLAGGSSAFVFDVKCGSGAFMQDLVSAKTLAKQLVSLSSFLGRTAMALVTDMSQPLGKWVGNAAEVMEAIEVLKGSGPPDTRLLSIKLAGAMLFLGGRVEDLLQGEEAAERSLDSGEGFAMFERMVKAQGGDIREFIKNSNNKNLLAPSVHDVRADRDGWVNHCDARAIGEVVRLLDGGRLTREQEIDQTVCCELLAKTGDRICKGDIVARLYCQKDDSRKKEALARLEGAFNLGEEVRPGDIVIDVEGPVFAG